MRVEELKKREQILAKYGKGLATRYENYKEGSLILAILFFIGSAIFILFSTGENKTIYLGIGFTLISAGVILIFLTGLFKLLSQIKEISILILLKSGDHIDKEKTP